MKIKIYTAIATSFIIASTVFADETELGKQMETMNDAYKQLRRIEDMPKGAELARECQDAMVKAITLLPEMVKAMPDGPEKAKASASYRSMMGKLISSLADLELAFLNNDKAKVDEIVQALRDTKKDGHDKFMEEE